MTNQHVSAAGDGAAATNRPGLAVVVNVLTPYRVHLHSRIASEIPQCRLHTVLTHAKTEFSWEMNCPPSIHAVNFNDADEHSTDSELRHPLRQWAKAKRIVAYLKANHVKAMILMGYNDLTRLRILHLCRREKIKVFLRGDSNIRGDQPRSWFRRMMKKSLIRWVIRRCDVVMPMGRLGQAFFEKYGATADRCIWVPYEPDYAAFARAEDGAIQSLRRKFDLPKDRRYLLFSGRLVPVKRVDLLVDAFARLADERPNWDLLIVGDGPMREELENRLPQTLRSRVHWLGFMQVEQLIPTYHLADILVLPSDYEPWALVINEAVAAGLVVVSSDVVGAAHELVEDGVNGRLFASGSLAALTEALRDATAEDRLVLYQQAVAPALARWRQKADPVEGIRKALRKVGILSVNESAAPGTE